MDIETAKENIIDLFKTLKRKGFKATNPDQSYAFTNNFADLIKLCRERGFSDSDMDIMFNTAKNL